MSRAGVERRVSAGALATMFAIVAAAARADPPVLHEFVPDVDPDEPVRALARARGRSDAVVYDGALVEAPVVSAAAPAMTATPGDGMLVEEPGRRSAAFAPDRVTHLDGGVDYHEGFSPSIAPFKRVTALDAVALASDGRTPVLVVREPALVRVPVVGADAPQPDGRPRDRFWGRVRLDFGEGPIVPMPSVSPDSRILTWRTEAHVAAHAERDGAGNYFVVLDGAAPARPVELSFLTDAPAGYFGAEIPRVPVASPQDRASVPAEVRARALAFARELGVTPASDLRTAAHALTAHFRAFEESVTPPPDTGDVYLDLARGKKGICRHRAYAFVVTAHALGIPARFVQNEAHAWVEVELPTNGWMRIDLGGAAHGLTAHDTDARPAYRPATPDRLPRPEAYEDSLARARGPARGAPGAQPTPGQWIEPSPRQGGTSAGAPSGGSRADDASTGTAARTPARPSDEALDGEPVPATAWTPGLGPVPRRPLRVRLDPGRVDVLRGRKLTVTGRVDDPGNGGVAGLRVEVSLAAQGRAERLLLGVTVTGEGGYFRGAFGVPIHLDVGDYRVVAVTPGDDTHLPAAAE